MKIATITCHRAYNYGAVLQTYALQKFLTVHGADVTVLDYVPLYLRREKNKVKAIIKFFVQYFDMKKKKVVFETFLNDYINLSSQTFRNVNELEEYKDIFDLYITGSDQVWNMNMDNGNDDSYFLSFVHKPAKKVSYAASMAMENITSSQKKRFRLLLRDFYKISVRESTAKRLLEDIGIPCERLCDPVFLLDKNEWSDFAGPKTINEKYVLVYAFYGQADVYEYAKKIAKERNCKVFSVSASKMGTYRKVDRIFWCVSPNEFVRLIRDAETVVTNSFHGLSFSIIFNKKVHIFKTNKNGNNRITDMLQFACGDSSIPISEQNLVGIINDYAEVNSKMEKHIFESKAFLMEELDNG